MSHGMSREHEMLFHPLFFSIFMINTEVFVPEHYALDQVLFVVAAEIMDINKGRQTKHNRREIYRIYKHVMYLQ